MCLGKKSKGTHPINYARTTIPEKVSSYSGMMHEFGEQAKDYPAFDYAIEESNVPNIERRVSINAFKKCSVQISENTKGKNIELFKSYGSTLSSDQILNARDDSDVSKNQNSFCNMKGNNNA